VWAEEDGAMSLDTPQAGPGLHANQARSSIENMTDEIAETDQISAGPMLERLLSAMRPEHRASPSDDKPMTNGVVNGDMSVNGMPNGDLIGIFNDFQHLHGLCLTIK
jgi:transcriptional adapter 3